MATSNWSREELILAFRWYCTKIPFSKIKYTKAEIVELGSLIGRTPSAVAFKLVNFARFDPELQKRGVSGMRHGSKAEQAIWNEFNSDWDRLIFESELILRDYEKRKAEPISEDNLSYVMQEGIERETQIKARVNQSFFRRTVLLSYNTQCCISRIDIPELLNASHIIPWSKNLKEACNPRNGLCLNALYDRAFDRGLLTIDSDFNVIVSDVILKNKNSKLTELFLPYHGRKIELPDRFCPDKSFLEYHKNNIFKAA